MSDNRTLILSGAGGRLATVQPGVASWHYIHWIDAREFSAWYLAGVKLDGHVVDERTVEIAVSAEKLR